MMKPTIIPCHECKGTGSVIDKETNGQSKKTCRWCNGTGDEDYQDRAYEEWRDNRKGN